MFHADGVSMLQPQPSGTRFHHSSAHHPLVVDSRAGLKTHLFTQACMRTPLRTCVEERIILHLRGTGFRRRLLVCVS